MKPLIALLLLSQTLATAAHAEAIPQATAAAKPIVLKAAHLFDGRTGTMSTPGLIVVQGQRIVAVGGNAGIPVDARIIDLGDATLLPGFIDAHVHLTSDHNENWAQGFYEDMLRFPVEQSFCAARNAKVTLEAGFTSVRNVGASDFIDIGLRKAIDANVAEGPRIIAAGHSIGSTGGHCDNSPRPNSPPSCPKLTPGAARSPPIPMAT